MYTRHDAYELHIKGLVQGVGFRPFVYRIARMYGIRGSVSNRNDGVHIQMEGAKEALEQFEKALKQQKPGAASIHSVEKRKINANGYSGFSIENSSGISQAVTEVSPDIAVCPACLRDMKGQEHRIGYPFINCTHCGPRFTITKELPYDRQTTSMERFLMCPVCRAEYKDVEDRRFHAQPVACNRCGPQYTLKGAQKPEEVVPLLAGHIENGGIAVLKGLGGYHLLCDACCDDAVLRLRDYKQRDKKPFALLCRSLESLQQKIPVAAAEARVMASWRRPIVLLEAETTLFPEVRAGMNNIGVMLPYMPVHYLLFEHVSSDWLVCTSGNLSGYPLWTRKEDIRKESVHPVAVADHNREIVNRADDSVVQIIDKEVHIIRRSRGYVPSSITLSTDPGGILAVGAERTGAFCIGKTGKAIMSQYIGDLQNYETVQFYEETLERFRRLFRFEPELIACDMHPAYHTTRLALSSGLPLVQVQHHHAHIAACQADHRIDGPLIGLSMDGTGYGPDGTVWGGEILYCADDGYERMMHFDPVAMPGGDKAVEEPWRMALAYIYQYCPGELNACLPRVADDKKAMVCAALQKQINSPPASSCGRLFDAVAALTDTCIHAGYQAQAPMLLEAIRKETPGRYSFEMKGSKICFGPMISGILEDIRKGTSPGEVSGKFHNTLLKSLATAAQQVSAIRNNHTIILSGGCFQNRFLLYRLKNRLEAMGMTVYYPRQVPCNDGGIALGQLYIAAKKRNRYVS